MGFRLENFTCFSMLKLLCRPAPVHLAFRVNSQHSSSAVNRVTSIPSTARKGSTMTNVVKEIPTTKLPNGVQLPVVRSCPCHKILPLVASHYTYSFFDLSSLAIDWLWSWYRCSHKQAGRRFSLLRRQGTDRNRWQSHLPRLLPPRRCRVLQN